MPPKKATSNAASSAPMTRKRKAVDIDEEEKENVPAPKKTRGTTIKAQNTKSAAKKPATVLKAATKSRAAATKPKDTHPTRKSAPKRKAANDIEDQPVTKKAKTIKAEKKNPSTKAISKKATTIKAPTSKAATTKAAVPKTTTSQAASKKASASKAPLPKKAATKPKAVVDPINKIKPGIQINKAPTHPLDIFVFGEGSAGELGLGARKINGKKPIDVKRPRLNPLLSAKDVGVVQMACGGMHAIALTKDNKVFTWGVNDQGALGRDTAWDGGMVDADAAAGGAQQSESGEDEDEDDDSGLNPRESTPTEINTKHVAPGTKFVHVAACDSASFALTADGRVYSWGTFRVSFLSPLNCSVELTH